MYLEQLQIHLHSRLNTWLQCIGQRQLQDKMRNIWILGFDVTYIRGLTVVWSSSCWKHHDTQIYKRDSYETHTTYTTVSLYNLNTLWQRQNGHHFADRMLKCIFLNENVWISLKISLEFVPKVPINNIPALVQIMAWHLPGNKPLSEPMTVC